LKNPQLRQPQLRHLGGKWILWHGLILPQVVPDLKVGFRIFGFLASAWCVSGIDDDRGMNLAGLCKLLTAFASVGCGGSGFVWAPISNLKNHGSVDLSYGLPPPWQRNPGEDRGLWGIFPNSEQESKGR